MQACVPATSAFDRGTLWPNQSKEHVEHLLLVLENHVHLNVLQAALAPSVMSYQSIERTSGIPKGIITKVEATMRTNKHHLPVNLCLDEVRACPKKTAIKQKRPHMSACIYDADKRALNKTSKLLLTRSGNLNTRTKPLIVSALEMESDLRVAYYTLQLFFEWSDTTHKSRIDMQSTLKRWISKAKSTKIDELNRCANTINRNIDYILNAWEHGRTNAVAEGLNRCIKDIIRQSRGFNSFEALRRRCLLVLGHKRKPKGPIPLFKRKPKKEVKAG